jgi:hypothetical protein
VTFPWVNLAVVPSPEAVSFTSRPAAAEWSPATVYFPAERSGWRWRGRSASPDPVDLNEDYALAADIG